MSNRLDRQEATGRAFYMAGRGNMFGWPTHGGADSNATTGVPTNGIQGFAPGALFFNWLATKPGNMLYVNVGTFTSAIWLNLEYNSIQPQSFKNATLSSASQTPTYTAAQLTGGDFTTLILTGAPAGAVTGTMDTTAAILAAIGSPAAGYVWRIRVLNHGLAQTVTLTAGDGSTTISGTATVATNTWRDFDATVATATTLTLQSVGTGTES